jgi:solute carrier family 25 phosphate transporter 23/24/25/41
MAKEHPSLNKLLKQPLALVSFVPRELSLFFVGTIASAAAKTVTTPLDRVKLLMQVCT